MCLVVTLQRELKRNAGASLDVMQRILWELSVARTVWITQPQQSAQRERSATHDEPGSKSASHPQGPARP